MKKSEQFSDEKRNSLEAEELYFQFRRKILARDTDLGVFQM